MTPRHTVRILLTTWLLAAVGCSWLPSPGPRDMGAPMASPRGDGSWREDLPGGPPLSQQPSGSASSLPRQMALPPTDVGLENASGHPTGDRKKTGDRGLSACINSAGVQGVGPMQTPPTQALAPPARSPEAQGLLAAGSAAMLEPMADMSAFVQELEAVPGIDAAGRSQILTTVLQAPPELQPQLIGQYRRLLALGKTSAVAPAPAAAPEKRDLVPVAALQPAETAVEAKKESVIAASHNEPIETGKSPPTGGTPSDVEHQLEALLLAMKGAKAEPEKDPAASDPASDAASGAADDRPDKAPAKTIAADSNLSWEQLIDSAIRKLEERKERQLDSDIREEDEARLRMLYLIADRRDDAVRAIATLQPEMQEYWSKQFFALATLLNSDLIADRSNRLIESKRNLDEAVRRLGESAPLFVRNLAFVTAVQSYGAYTPFDDYEFKPGEPVLLYAEVENYRCKETARGYHTALRSSYEIFDSSHQKVDEHEFSTNEEYCKNARRDFFTICEFRIPEKLNPGKYVLRLTVADLNGDKAGESSITFQIRDGS